MKEAEEQLGKRAGESFKEGRYFEGLVGFGLQKFIGVFAEVENLMPYNIPDHFLSAGQYAKRWIWYDMRGQSGKGLLELVKGQSEAASAVGSLELAGAGLKMVGSSGLSLKVTGEIGASTSSNVTEGVKSFNDELGYVGRNNCYKCSAAFLDAVRTKGVQSGEITASQYPSMRNGGRIELVNNYLSENLQVELGPATSSQMPARGHYVVYPNPYVVDGFRAADHVVVGWNLGYGPVFYDPQIGRRIPTPATYTGFQVHF
jgi:hypothetical protein